MHFAHIVVELVCMWWYDKSGHPFRCPLCR